MSLKSILSILMLSLFGFSHCLFAQVEVWPGDVNNNGAVNHYDLLYFGLGYSFQGPPRLQKSVTFQGQQTTVWNQFLPNQTNYAYLDCNGNGHISPDDTIAIRLNYKNQHGIVTQDVLSDSVVNGIPIGLFAESDTVLNRSRISFAIELGDTFSEVDSFYGVAFTLNYDTQRVQAGSFSVQLDAGTWVKTGGGLLDNPLLMAFEEENAGQLNVALSKTNLVNAKGYGKLLDISCVIEDNLIGKGFAALNFKVSDILLIGNDLDRKPVKGAEESINILPTTIQSPVDQDPTINIYPNPASAEVKIATAYQQEWKWQLFDLEGRILESRTVEGQNIEEINVNDLKPGLYLIHIISDQKESIRKIIKY